LANTTHLLQVCGHYTLEFREWIAGPSHTQTYAYLKTFIQEAYSRRLQLAGQTTSEAGFAGAALAEESDDETMADLTEQVAHLFAAAGHANAGVANEQLAIFNQTLEDMRVNQHHMEHQLMMMASGFGGEATTTTTIKGQTAHSAQTSETMCNEHSRCSTRRSSRRNVVRPLSSPPTSNKPWLTWPTISKGKAAMEAAEVEEAEEDEEHEEATHRQDSGRPWIPAIRRNQCNKRCKLCNRLDNSEMQRIVLTYDTSHHHNIR